MSSVLRLATLSDAEAILSIYAPYVRDTAISFECEVPALEAFRARMADVMAAYPYLVCEEAGKVIGYGYAHRFKERAAYSWGAELSVYLAPGYTNRGTGTRIGRALIEILRLQHICNIYSGVALPNEASLALHRRIGFKPVGTYIKTGYKNGRWHDVMLFECHIGPHSDAPAPFIGIHEVDPAAIREILSRA